MALQSCYTHVHTYGRTYGTARYYIPRRRLLAAGIIIIGIRLMCLTVIIRVQRHLNQYPSRVPTLNQNPVTPLKLFVFPIGFLFEFIGVCLLNVVIIAGWLMC